MAKKATTLHDILGNDLLPVTNASITFMDNGTSVQAEIIDLKLKTQYNKGHFTTPEELNSVYPSTYPDGTIISNEDSKLREGWYAVVGSTDTIWIWDVQGKEWVNSGSSIGAVESVNGLDGEVILTGSNINATATIDTTSVTKSVNGHLNDIYSNLENKLNVNSENVVFTNTNQDITGLKTIKSDHEYDGVPPSMLELNNNHLGNTRKLGLSTTENFNLYLTSYYPDSENYKYLSELSLQGQYLLFGRLDGQTFSNVNGIKFENNDLYKMYIDYTNQSLDQKRILTESDLSDLVDLSNPQTITGLKIFTDTIGLANTSEGTIDQIKHINNNFLITSGTGQNLLNIDEGLETISAFNRQLAYEDEIQQIQGDYATKDELSQEIQNVTDMIPTNISELTNDANYATTIQVNNVQTQVNTINSKIPNQASSTNQLADRDFVNSSINSVTAFYITYNANGDPFPTKLSLTNATTYYSGGEVRVPTRNDYAIVLQDETKDNVTTRYIYYNQWEYQYTVNETALTADQLSAINSGITSTLVSKISSNEQMLNSLSEQVATDYATKSELSSLVTTDTTQRITGSKIFSGTVGNTQTEAGVYLGLDTNTGAENANMAIVSANTASYIDMGRPNVDYDFRIIKWNGMNDNNARFEYSGNASGIITIPQKTGTIALISDIPDVSGKLTGTKFATNASFNTYLPYTESGSGNTSPVYVATFVNNSARNGLTFSSISNLKTQMGIPNFVTLTQAEYDALSTKDSNTYYFIKE